MIEPSRGLRRQARSTLRRARAIFNEPDVRAHPLRGVVRRARWRWHWHDTNAAPLAARTAYGQTLLLPRSGSAAPIYYRGVSDAAIADTLRMLLEPGMHVIDIGAHVGEFSILAADLVGTTGTVFAFEPQHYCAELVRRSAALNGLANVEIFPYVVSDRSGQVPFGTDPRSMGGWIGQSEDEDRESVTLDSFVAARDPARIGLVKVDAAGNEIAVLEGGAAFLAEDRRLAIICKLYNPRTASERFGVDSRDVVRRLLEWRFDVLALTPTAAPLRAPGDATALFRDGAYSVALVARRRVAGA